MILTINVGNSNIVVGVYRENRLIHKLRIKTDTTKTEDEYTILFNSTLRINHISVSDIEGAIISSVVPNLSEVLSLAVHKLIGRAPLTVGPGIKTGLAIKIDNPSQLGSDLVVCAVAALEKYTAPIIIIYMDAATTFSAVDAGGNFVGAAIYPGLNVSREALAQNAAQLFQIDLAVPRSPIGTNTADSMRAGLILGYADMIDGMCKRFKNELGQDATVIMTGDQAKKILPHCSTDIRFEENLLTDGLLRLYKKNTK